jgi:hypothetical protein
LYLRIIFDAGQSADDAMKMEVDWLVADDELNAAKDYRIFRFNDYGLINCAYKFPSDFLAKISQAKLVGLGLQFAEDAPTFLGVNNLPFEEGAAKLPGLLTLYHRAR